MWCSVMATYQPHELENEVRFLAPRDLYNNTNNNP